VLRLDLSTGRVLARSPRLGADTVEIAETGRLQRRMPVGREPKGITAEVDGGMWVVNAGECTLSRIQPR
jgi:hypothetical protein